MALRRSCRCRPRSSAWLLLVTKRGFRWQGPPSPLTWRHRCPPCVPVGDWSGRLQAIFDAVPDGARVADLGCGHGRVAFALAASGKAAWAVAVDRSADAIAEARAYSQARCCGESLPWDVRQGDGLKALQTSDGANVAVVAGMGAASIWAILRPGHAPAPLRWAGGIHTLVVQPQGDGWHALRAQLRLAGWRVASETLVSERGRLSNVLVFCRAHAWAEGVLDAQDTPGGQRASPLRTVPVIGDQGSLHGTRDPADRGVTGSMAASAGDLAAAPSAALSAGASLADVHLGAVLHAPPHEALRTDPTVLHAYLRFRLLHFQGVARMAPMAAEVATLYRRALALHGG